MELRGSDVGRLIGRRGATIQRLKADTRAVIELEEEDNAKGNRVVRLKGTYEAREACVREIRKICWNAVVVFSS